MNNLTLDDYIPSVILSICMISSCLCWIRVIRSITHLSYVISSWHSKIADPVSPTTNEFITTDIILIPSSSLSSSIIINQDRINKQKTYEFGYYLTKTLSYYFTFGIKFIYIAIPYYFLTFGPISFYTSTIVILIIESIWDYHHPYTYS